jgi:hypothetical protein
VSKKVLHLTSRINKDGKLWEVTFSYRNRRDVKVSAKNLNGRDILTAPQNADEILNIIPIEYWPAFAVHLSNININQNEGLF